MKIKHISKNQHRLAKEAGNPREVAFAKEWKKRNSGSRTLLDYLQGDGQKTWNVTQDQATLAATIIQWLGTDVGMGFIADVANACPAVRQNLVDRVPDLKKVATEAEKSNYAAAFNDALGIVGGQAVTQTILSEMKKKYDSKFR